MKKMLLMLLITIPALSACLDDGKNGKVGATGPQGIQGATGAVGATGPAGTNGTNGTDGQNGGDGPDCRMGMFIAGAYLLQALNDGSGTLLHTTMVIVDTVLEQHPIDTGPLLFGVTAMETKTGDVITFFRGDDGLLTGPWVGSCLAPPPATGA